MPSRKKGASVSQGQKPRVVSRDRDTSKEGSQPQAASPVTKMMSVRTKVAKVTRSGVVGAKNSTRAITRARWTTETVHATQPRASKSRRTVTLQQPSADTESEDDAPDDETEDSIVEVQKPHKRQQQRTCSLDIQLDNQGEPAYIPTENYGERWRPGLDRQQGDTVTFGNSGSISHTADAN